MKIGYFGSLQCNDGHTDLPWKEERLYFKRTLLEYFRGFYRRKGPCRDCITEEVSPLVLLPLSLEKGIYKPDRYWRVQFYHSSCYILYFHLPLHTNLLLNLPSFSLFHLYSWKNITSWNRVCVKLHFVWSTAVSLCNCILYPHRKWCICL